MPSGAGSRRRGAGVLPDVLAPGLRIVFCGSAAGRVSAARRAYYAHPQNRFWPTLCAAGLTPRELKPHEYRKVATYGLGLTDMCKTASGADAALPARADDPEALRAKIARFRPAWLAFVGKRPARVFLGRAVDYGPQPERLGPTRIFVLPSPAPTARAFWDEGRWRELARRAGPAPAAAGGKARA